MTRTARFLPVLMLAATVIAGDAVAQYGSYRGSKYSGGFGGTAFTSRRHARQFNRGLNHSVYVPGLFSPFGYGGLGLGFGGLSNGGLSYGYVPYGSPYGFLGGGVGYGGVGYGGLGYGHGYYTDPGYSPYVYSPYDYLRYGTGVRTIGVTPGAAYSPGVSFGSSYQRRGFATVGAYGSSFAGGYTSAVSPTTGIVSPAGLGFADPYVIPQAPLTPTQSYYTEDAETARRLRQMLRDEETGGLSAAAVAHRVARPVYSDAADKARSVRHEERGDRQFAAQEYLRAYTAYKDAVDAAGDRVEPRAKLVITYAAIGQYDRAVGELKTLLTLDPTYPRHYLSLDSLFGDNQLSKESTKTRVAEWTAGHVADPDRLLLLGAIMYFDGDIDRSRLLFDKVTLYDDLAPLAAGFRSSDTVTIPPNVTPSSAAGEDPPLPPLAPGERLIGPVVELPTDEATAAPDASSLPSLDPPGGEPQMLDGAVVVPPLPGGD